MHTVVPSNLPAPEVPLNWAVTAPADGKIMYTAHLSIGEDGQFADETIEEQTRQTMNDIKASVEGPVADLESQCPHSLHRNYYHLLAYQYACFRPH
jgi:hypothetical protein